MPKTARTPAERLADLEKLQDQLKARIQREKAKLRVSDRKQDTRRKIIAGALALEHGTHDPAFSAKLQSLIDQYVTRSDDRALFGLMPLQDQPQEQSSAAA